MALINLLLTALSIVFAQQRSKLSYAARGNVEVRRAKVMKRCASLFCQSIIWRPFKVSDYGSSAPRSKKLGHGKSLIKIKPVLPPPSHPHTQTHIHTERKRERELERVRERERERKRERERERERWDKF